MAMLHFLNVKNGDCTIVQHDSGRVTMIDVCNARAISPLAEWLDYKSAQRSASGGNFNQKKLPVNPIRYMQDRGIHKIFRFILTHPDMDHMDGIADVFDRFKPPNFWDTQNVCEKSEDGWDSGRFRYDDWEFYCSLRNGTGNARRLVHYSGQPPCKYWDEDGIQVLSPTRDLIAAANESGDWNDASYVLLFTFSHVNGGEPWKVVVSGDSHDATWEHILDAHQDKVSDVDLLLAPHHGRRSGRDYDFLDVLEPKLTLFGNAESEYLAYDAWGKRGLRYITNNQAGDIIVDFSSGDGDVYCTNERWAQKQMSVALPSEDHKAWLCDFIRVE